METRQARFTVGQLISHKLFNYRGVIFDVDPCFMGSEEWYSEMALTRPPKDNPWYRVLVHNAPDESVEPVMHPLVDTYFADFRGGQYIPHSRSN
ncbi:MAG: heat shock protein HspQ [Gammaproteobacteria bacterium]